VFVDDFLEHFEVLRHNSGIKSLSTAPFKWHRPLDLDVQVSSNESFWPCFSNGFTAYVACIVS
jgi:hypothetical protein